MDEAGQMSVSKALTVAPLAVEAPLTSDMEPNSSCGRGGTGRRKGSVLSGMATSQKAIRHNFRRDW